MRVLLHPQFSDVSLTIRTARRRLHRVGASITPSSMKRAQLKPVAYILIQRPQIKRRSHHRRERTAAADVPDIGAVG